MTATPNLTDNVEAQKALEGLCRRLAEEFAEAVFRRMPQITAGMAPSEISNLVDSDVLADIAGVIVDIVDLKVGEFRLDSIRDGNEARVARMIVNYNADIIVKSIIGSVIERIASDAEDEFMSYAHKNRGTTTSALKILHIAARNIEAFPTIFPDNVYGAVLADFEAIRLGEAPTIFTKHFTGHHKGGERRALQLKALEHVAFQMGKGSTRDKADGEVADAYGVEQETVDTWRKRLKKEYFPDLSERLEIIMQNGVIFSAHDTANHHASRGKFFEMLEIRFGKLAMERNGDAFRKINKGDS